MEKEFEDFQKIIKDLDLNDSFVEKEMLKIDQKKTEKEDVDDILDVLFLLMTENLYALSKIRHVYDEYDILFPESLIDKYQKITNLLYNLTDQVDEFINKVKGE